MTEEYLRLYGEDFIEAESAGIDPGKINPVVAELLKEDGIDISGKETQSTHELHESGKYFDYVIAVCDPEASEQCPIFPAEKKRFHWPFPDPSKAEGTMEEKKRYVRPIREEIKDKVKNLVAELRKEHG
jgi:arsenate reductase (thioredoxin)